MNVRMAKTLRTGSFFPFDHWSFGFVWSLMLGPWCFEKPGSYFAGGPKLLRGFLGQNRAWKNRLSIVEQTDDG